MTPLTLGNENHKQVDHLKRTVPDVKLFKYSLTSLALKIKQHDYSFCHIYYNMTVYGLIIYYSH